MYSADVVLETVGIGAALAHAFRRSMVALSAPDPVRYARRIALIKGPAAAPVVLHQESGSHASALRRFWSGLLAPLSMPASPAT